MVANRQMLPGNAAAAWAARLAEVDYVPAFPITPQTEIIEDLAGWFADGHLPGKFVTLDSEHSMLMAAGAAAATGCRVFTATSSQGLIYGLEALWTMVGWRVPFVLVLFVVTFLDAAVHQCYFFWTGRYLEQGVGIPGNWVMPVMSVGQIAEIGTLAFLGLRSIWYTRFTSAPNANSPITESPSPRHSHFAVVGPAPTANRKTRL